MAVTCTPRRAPPPGRARTAQPWARRAPPAASLDGGLLPLSLPILAYMYDTCSDNKYKRRMTVRPRLYIGRPAGAAGRGRAGDRPAGEPLAAPAAGPGRARDSLPDPEQWKSSSQAHSRRICILWQAFFGVPAALRSPSRWAAATATLAAMQLEPGPTAQLGLLTQVGPRVRSPLRSPAQPLRSIPCTLPGLPASSSVLLL